LDRRFLLGLGLRLLGLGLRNLRLSGLGLRLLGLGLRDLRLLGRGLRDFRGDFPRDFPDPRGAGSRPQQEEEQQDYDQYQSADYQRKSSAAQHVGSPPSSSLPFPGVL
jgi:hypothetical protein